MPQVIPDSSETKVLLERLAQGDDEALELLLARHEAMIANLARRRALRRVAPGLRV